MVSQWVRATCIGWTGAQFGLGLSGGARWGTQGDDCDGPDRALLEEVVRHPERTDVGYHNRLIAQKGLDESRVHGWSMKHPPRGSML